MQISLQFETTKNWFPIEFRKVIMSLIKNSIKDESISLYDKYYGNTSKKNFTFSFYSKNPKLCNEKFEIEDNSINVSISTSDSIFGYLLMNVLNHKLYKPYPLGNDNYLILKNIRQHKDKIIKTNEIICKTTSPICVCEHKKGDNKSTRFYSIDSSQFIESIKEKYFVEFIPIDCKKTIVRHQKMKFETTRGTFKLKGTPYTLQKLYLDGLGSRTGEGFGKFDIIE